MIGHLDRCVAGTVAIDILESCNEETSAPSQAVREHQRKFRLHQHLTNVTNRLPFDIKTPTVVNRMKSHVSSIHHHVSGVLNRQHSHQSQCEFYLLLFLFSLLVMKYMKVSTSVLNLLKSLKSL